MGLPGSSAGKESTHFAEDPRSNLGWEDSLEKRQVTYSSILGLPWWLRWSRLHLQYGRPGINPWVRKIPWRRAWQCPPVFFPGESPRSEEPGMLQSIGLQGVILDWVTKHSISFITCKLYSHVSCCHYM